MDLILKYFYFILFLVATITTLIGLGTWLYRIMKYENWNYGLDTIEQWDD